MSRALTPRSRSTAKEPRSGCPINLSLELLGDRWTLLVLRDLMFSGRRHYRELLHSGEGIASNILADRLRRLLEAGLITKRDDPTHRQRAIFSLTEQAIQLVPVFATLGAWGSRWMAADSQLAARARELEAGGPRRWKAFMAELRATHLGAVHTSPRASADRPAPSRAPGQRRK
jgi:DNA-binding HxlR family transcriptional regulator